MKVFTKVLLATVMAAGATLPAAAEGWPANYEGVMLQGFYWNSYEDTKWTNLEAQSDELSQYFDLIWIPNSGYCGYGDNMGYMPQYWFTNHNSSFGSEEELLSMISTFKSKGVGMIADVVINHRNGVTNWTDFPSEEWNGKTWFIGPEGICCDDEVAAESGQAKPTGGYDTGDGFNGCRDLDHTNANVQENCKNYCLALLQKYGYAGFRYDMVKGYSGYYNKIYNQYSKPTFSVGEYWDSGYDAVAAWIDATGKESAAFDFPCKYQINKAFSGDMTQLVWNALGTTPQPAGMIHYGYGQYSVTFVDNHDTYRDGSKFNGNVVAANAFILFSPGTPCVFLPHYQEHKTEIQKLISLRKKVGIHNCSKVTVLKSAGNCYMAEIIGTKGKAVVKVGSAMESPAGYTNDQIEASGTDYCIWISTEGGEDVGGGGGDDNNDDPDAKITVYFTGTGWATPHIHYWGGSSESKYPGVAMTTTDTKNVWSYTIPAKSTGILFNAGDGDATKTDDFKPIDGHVYSTAGDLGLLEEYLEQSSSPYVIYYNNQSTSWTTPHIHYWGGESESSWPGVKMVQVSKYIWKYICPEGTTGILFNAGDGDATKTGNFTPVSGHVYTRSGNSGEYHIAKGPEKLYILGNIEKKTHWSTSDAHEMTHKGNTFEITIRIQVPETSSSAPGMLRAESTNGFFSFATGLGDDWDELNGAGDRFGAPAAGTPLTDGEAHMFHYQKDVNNSSAESWTVPAGRYKIVADFPTMTVKAIRVSSLEDVEAADADADATPVYYNLQGQRVANPANGLYIVVRGSKVTKEYVR